MLGPRHLYCYGNLTFFDGAGCGSCSKSRTAPGKITAGAPLYLICHDIDLATGELAARGVEFDSPKGKRT